MRTSNGLEFADELDGGGDLMIDIVDDIGPFSTWINKDDAIQIVAHLTRVFELVPANAQAIGRALRKIDTPVEVSEMVLTEDVTSLTSFTMSVKGVEVIDREEFSGDTLLSAVEWKEIEDCDGAAVLYSARLTDGGMITVLDRVTGYGYGLRDVESGYRDETGKFWLASGGLDVRRNEGFSVDDAVRWVKEHANTCTGA